MTPPFKPVVESDESTSNFDPEFTSADLREVGGADMMDLDGALADDDDPSAAWVAQSLGAALPAHTPNGPLGSERSPLPAAAASTAKVAAAASPLAAITNGASAPRAGIAIRGRDGSGSAKGGSAAPLLLGGSPLTSSVQENFIGFTYHGGESVVAPRREYFSARRAAQAEKEAEHAVEDADADIDDAQGATTEDELEDVGRSAGRYAHARFDEDMS